MPVGLDKTQNILVLGKDQRDGDPTWRTDTIMVVAVDYAAEQVGVISIPRDLYIELPGVGQARINQADYYGEAIRYPGGGAALVRRVLTETLGISTQHYVRIEWDGLERLLDTLGGVTVTLTCPLYEQTPDANSPNGLADWTLPAGQVWLDGAAAKKFAIYRYVTSDFGRAQRQQQLLWAIRDRALQLDLIPRIPELWKALADSFTTDLSVLDAVRLARLGAGLRPSAVHGVVISDDVLEHFVTEEGGWVLVVQDGAKLEQELADIFRARPLAEPAPLTPDQCPPPPTPAPTFTPTLAPSPTPTASG